MVRPVGSISANSPVWMPAKSASMAALPVSTSIFFNSGRASNAISCIYRINSAAACRPSGTPTVPSNGGDDVPR